MLEIKLDKNAISSILKVYREMKGDEKLQYVGTLHFSDNHVVRRYVQRDSDGELTNLIEFDLMTSTEYDNYRFKVMVCGKYYATPNLVYTKNL